MQDFAELIVANNVEPCPYLQGREACLPLRYPLRRLEPEEFDACMAAGDRRTGMMLYRPACGSCEACEPIRVEVSRFQPSRTQRRVKRRGDMLIEVDVGPPGVDARRVALFNKHRNQRGLRGRGRDIGPAGYRQFLLDTCCETLELRYRMAGKLIAVGIADRGATCLSAVYSYFDPEFSSLSPGVYSVLTQIELCRRWEKQYLYLGYYVAKSAHMSYKGGYRPHERLIGGRWRRFE